MIFAILSAIANAIENILDKVVLEKKEISHKHFLSISITFIFLMSLTAHFFIGNYSSDFFTLKYLWAFSGMVFCAFLYNILFFWAMSKEELCDVEPFVLIDRPATIILAAVIFASERSLWPLVFSLIAATALVASRVEKKHFQVRKTTLALMGFIFLIATESIFVKITLEVLAPVTLYAFRTGILTILFWVFLHPNIRKIKLNEYALMFGNSVFTFIQYTARFYAIMYIGIVQTNLLLLLGPVIAIIMSKTFLKEHVTLKKVLADAIIVICVIATLIIR